MTSGHPFNPRAANAGFDVLASIVDMGALYVGDAAASSSGSAAFTSRVRLPAGREMSAGAAGVTGIATDEARGAEHPPFEEAYASLMDFLAGHVQAAGPGAYLLLIGHNIKRELMCSPSLHRPTALFLSVPLLEHPCPCWACHAFPAAPQGSTSASCCSKPRARACRCCATPPTSTRSRCRKRCMGAPWEPRASPKALL